MHALLLCVQNLCTLFKFGDYSDYITTFTVYISDWPSVRSRWPATGCVPFFRFYGLRDHFLQLHCRHCPKITKFLSPPHAMFFLCWIWNGYLCVGVTDNPIYKYTCNLRTSHVAVVFNIRTLCYEMIAIYPHVLIFALTICNQ